ncbi:MAG: dTDP-4-dehydrorhamnose 3,5-epimerase [Hyphomicrobium zavarzinii]|jgi:dTDP-4-dehydrorhamnose 3,5-epimerase|uniref:dTDP-4-dehydrorhamnose 3,5-epimerase n=1 Tax=Hyphomicrobium zavarzinii TaxID=48292 RepID=UPI001A4461C7|nr:dTDP-4-dehydrorhamnose 3,5-epimerase [Hyphomicrobium zavarzinii]MBL8844654.1 dTDP-4-dehydrorhamnose 3,5-epimerase [Hyphomicrobium zavarzinii]
MPDQVIFERCHIPDVIKITPKRHGDSRGHFVELFRADLFQSQAGDVQFVQYNQSLSRPAGTVRGLHYQIAPAAQGKLVRCAQGAMLDVAVDVRRSSPTFGQHVAVKLSSEDDSQLWIPPGFAHGFCTLVPDTEVWYAVTSTYSPEHERGVLWNDPDLNIAWPLAGLEPLVSPRDAKLPRFHDLARDFE